MLSLDGQMGLLRKKVGFRVVPSLNTNIIFGTVLIERFIEKIITKAGLIASINSSPFAIVNKTLRDYVLAIESHDNEGQPERLSAKQLCEDTRARTLATMSKTIVNVKTSAGGI